MPALWTQSNKQVGWELARLLAGSWRPCPPTDLFISDTLLNKLASAIQTGGVARLTWFRIRQNGMQTSVSVASRHREAWISSLIMEAAHEVDLERVSRALVTAGIRFILLKGWSVARSYPERGLRPLGDIDLWINPDQRPAAEVVIANLPITHALDLEHDQFRRFENRSFGDFYASCECAYVGSTSVKVLRPEDQIRCLCLHFLKHGGWRPIWLCDIAVLLESRNGTFDWDLCLGEDRRRARWIGSTIAVTRNLLDAKIPDGAPPLVTSSPPKWLTETVLREWSDPRPPSAAAFAFVLPSLWSRPWELKTVMRGRWRNAIQATVDCNGQFNALPRWPYQLRDATLRATRFRPQLDLKSADLFTN